MRPGEGPGLRPPGAGRDTSPGLVAHSGGLENLFGQGRTGCCVGRARGEDVQGATSGSWSSGS